MNPRRIPEAFLHFLWKTRRFEQRTLLTTHGAPLQILDPGQHNTHAGPDFLMARLKIGPDTWAGHVEIHVKASDWIAHKHPFDPAYQNVILHVVWEEDQPIYLADGSRLPCLELKDRTPAGLFSRYRQLQQSKLKVPCTSRIGEVPSLTRSAWLDRMLAERLLQKAERLKSIFHQTQADAEQSLRASIAYAMGLPVNAQPMQDLTLSFHHSLPARYRHNPLLTEALFFGQAGLLRGHFHDSWPQKLQKEYLFLANKHKLKPLPAGNWKWARMRPASFPGLRIAQLASLYLKHPHWFSAFRQMEPVSEIVRFFQIQPSAYWRKHHHWERPSARDLSRPGKELIHRILINALAPFFFFYGNQTGEQRFKDLALHWLHQLPAENNHITRKWKDFGWNIPSAEHSQAIIHLQKNYCNSRKCLQCAIGHALLKP